MKIVIDGRMLGWTGIGRYTKALLEELQQLDRQTEYVVLIRQKDWELWQPSQPNFTRVQTTIEPYSLGEQVQLAWLLYRLQADLVHFLAFNAPILYFKARVTTIHDATLLDYKTARGGGWLAVLYELKHWAMRLVFWWSTKTSKAVITDTEYGKSVLVSRGYAAAAKITAIHLGAPKLPTTTGGAILADPYLLYVGNLYPYKNLRRLIVAMPILRRTYPDLRLVIVGSADRFAAQLQDYARQQGADKAVIFTGFVSDEELAAYYSHAKLYVFPSLSEGFGLPPLEAMVRGLPVAAAKASCLPEVLGDAAAYFDPTDSADIARVIGETLADTKRLSGLKRAGLKRVKQFSWKRMAEQTLAVYKSALK
jgi:glycosyltransferase involved in cell wall biosynthesis